MPNNMNDGIEAAFVREQQRGLSVALKGRMAVLAVVALWIGTTRQPPMVFYMVGLVVVYAVIGLAQLWVVGRFGVRAWQLYLAMFLEVSILAVAIAVFAGPMTNDLPITLGFRFINFLYFFLFVAAAAFS